MSRVYGQRLMLREFRQEDISGMRSWATDNDTCAYLGGAYTAPQTWEKTEQTLSGYLNGDAGGANFAIADRESGRYLGQCSLFMIDTVARHAEMAIVLAPDSRGKGYAGEAIALLLEYAFDTMNLNRVHLRVYADNARAIACYERLGFSLEGTLRQHGYHAGRYVDVLCMGILRGEWTAAHPRGSQG